jgi:cell division protein FtsW
MIISRSDAGPIARWWFTVDKTLIWMILILMIAGVFVSLAASPAIADRLDLDAAHFTKGQMLYIAVATPLFLLVSVFPLHWLRRFAVGGFASSFALMLAAMVWGPEIKGAHRWIDVGVVTLQPSEFAKPFFVVVVAWFLSEHARRPDMPAQSIAYGLAIAMLGILFLQPDFGQALLVGSVFGAMLVVSGLPWIVVLALAALGLAGVGLAYAVLPHVASRIDRFLTPEKGDTFQIDAAMEAFRNGGFVGTGPGGGKAKLILPDAHTDFAWSVIGEEFGIVACMVLLAFFGAIVLRILIRARSEPDPFLALGLFGLGSLFGLQSFINMGVNSALLPAKGMTLPFISYGGSSLIGTAILMGFVLGLGRKQQRHASGTSKASLAAA